MTTRIIPIAAVQSLRIICRHCGFAQVLPLTIRNALDKCPNCYHELPYLDAVATAKALRVLQESAADVNIGFDAALEAVEERQ